MSEDDLNNQAVQIMDDNLNADSMCSTVSVSTTAVQQQQENL
jgi:hypothetical protein